jgi:hypothetical protein
MSTGTGVWFLPIGLWLLGGCTGTQLDRSVIFPHTVNITLNAYCPERAFRQDGLFVVNHSLLLDGNTFSEDHDRDGLTDIFESEPNTAATYNISAGSYDTNQDGYSDLAMYALGILPEQQDALPYCPQAGQDADRDALDDCDENLIGTNPNHPDVDGDGIPDGLEVLQDLNPFDSQDGLLDSDHDGLSMLEEVRYGTPLRYTNTLEINNHRMEYAAYSYTGEEEKICYRIDISRIPLSDVNNGNLIRLYLLEKSLVAEQGDNTIARKITVLISREVDDGTTFDISVTGDVDQNETRGFE